jgi:microsomal dipeptidase-like Zn-dependent dipeptidase
MFYWRLERLCTKTRKTDEQIKAFAEKRGVIGITTLFAKKLGKSMLTDDILDQIDYTVDLFGAKHVGFGSDVDFNSTFDRVAYISQHPENVDKPYIPALERLEIQMAKIHAKPQRGLSGTRLL